MADESKQEEPEDGDRDQKAKPSDEGDDLFLFALANALVPIFFRRRR